MPALFGKDLALALSAGGTHAFENFGHIVVVVQIMHADGPMLHSTCVTCDWRELL